ncbi:hypothetical protein D3C80_1513070 [compost metagenome]
MVDAAQTHADHQNHRQLQGNGQVRQVGLIGQRYAPATGTFDQGEICALSQHCAHRVQQSLHAQNDSGFAGRQMRGNGGLESEGIDLLVRQLDRTLGNQRQGIVIAQAFGAGAASGGYRFGPQRAQARQLRRMQQPGSHGGLADIGVGSGDEIGWAHFTSLLSAAFAVHRRPPDKWLAVLALDEIAHRPATTPASAPVRSARQGGPG